MKRQRYYNNKEYFNFFDKAGKRTNQYMENNQGSISTVAKLAINKMGSVLEENKLKEKDSSNEIAYKLSKIAHTTKTMVDKLLTYQPEEGYPQVFTNFINKAKTVADEVCKKYRTLDNDRFVILGEAGKGGMGQVFKAYDGETHSLVAIKTMISDDEVANQRFKREINAMKRLKPPFVQLVKVIEHPDKNGKKRKVIVMEYVDGKTLKQFIASNLKKKTYIGDITKYFIEIGEALMVAHTEGVAHRDIKPSNIMITKSGDLKIMDLGLSIGKLDARLTVDGEMIGTLDYMPNDQIGTVKNVSMEEKEKMDVYALGATLYHALTGKAPFEHVKGNVQKVFAKTKNKVDPKKVNPLIPTELANICIDAMENDKDKRVGMQEFVEKMKDFFEKGNFQTTEKDSFGVMKKCISASVLGLIGIILSLQGFEKPAKKKDAPKKEEKQVKEVDQTKVIKEKLAKVKAMLAEKELKEEEKKKEEEARKNRREQKRKKIKEKMVYIEKIANELKVLLENAPKTRKSNNIKRFNVIDEKIREFIRNLNKEENSLFEVNKKIKAAEKFRFMFLRLSNKESEIYPDDIKEHKGYKGIKKFYRKGMEYYKQGDMINAYLYLDFYTKKTYNRKARDLTKDIYRYKIRADMQLYMLHNFGAEKEAFNDRFPVKKRKNY